MKTFTRCIEDFVCLHCSADVKGNGYTNHCPKCLWSRDVDINPGDRASQCGDLMMPIGVETIRDGFIIIHKCEKCGKIARCRSNENDNLNEIIRLSKNPEFIFGK
ncbi:MAG: RNHCP domain-containing protein [Alphaproteobacteria bacterium]|nr:RNHCP domain-containing protein [Alphaproteobacteria bacterium]